MEQLSAIQWICGQLRARLLRDGIVPGDMANSQLASGFFRFRERSFGHTSLTPRYGTSRGEVQHPQNLRTQKIQQPHALNPLYRRVMRNIGLHTYRSDQHLSMPRV